MPEVKNNKTRTASGDMIGSVDFYATDGNTQFLAAQIRAVAEGTPIAGGCPVKFEFHAMNASGTLTKADTIAPSTSATEGWSTGAGGTVTQQTNKSTSVDLNTPTGEIVMNNASLASNTSVTFTLTCTAIALGDLFVVGHKSVGTSASYNVNAFPTAGQAVITVRNITTQALAEAIVLGFAVIKSATS